MEPLEDNELDAMLRTWETPPAPERMRTRFLAAKPPRRNIWSASIRIPLPVAVLLLCALALGAWRWARPPEPRVVTRTERVEVPIVTERVVTRVVYRDRPAVILSQLQPVTELRPRIIRSQHAEN